MFGYLFNYLSYTTGDHELLQRGREPRRRCWPRCCRRTSPDVLLQGMPMFGGALMMVLGAIVAGNGYGWGTWKTVFTQGRLAAPCVLGSLAALTVFVVATVMATLVL